MNNRSLLLLQMIRQREEVTILSCLHPPPLLQSDLQILRGQRQVLQTKHMPLKAGLWEKQEGQLYLGQGKRPSGCLRQVRMDNSAVRPLPPLKVTFSTPMC